MNNNCKPVLPKITITRIQPSCSIKVAFGFSLGGALSAALALAGRNGKLIKAVKTRSFHYISQLYSYQPPINIFCLEGHPTITLGCFTIKSSWPIKFKCQPFGISSQVSITIKRYLCSEDMMGSQRLK